jgi:CHAT domain-containing protein
MLGALPDALTEIREAMKIIESLRSSLARYELRYSYFALMQDYYALYIDLLLQMHKQNPDQSLVAAAFEASESTRARSLREILTEAKVDIRAGVPEELLSRERELQRELNVTAKYYLRLKNYKRTEAEAREVEREVRRLKNDYSEVEAQIRAQSPRYAELTRPELPATREIQTKLLDDKTVLLEFFLGAEKSYLWLLSNTSLQVHELPKRDDLEKAAQDIYELITARQPLPQEDPRAYENRVAEADAAYWPQAAALSKTLLGPVVSEISGKRLLIVTDGALQYIPFGALPDPNTANATEPTPLIVEHEIINLPSAATLYSLRQEQPQAIAADRLLAVFADPVFANTDPRVAKQARAAATASPDEESKFIPAGFTARDLSPSDPSTIPRLPSTRVEGDAIMKFVPEGQGFVASGFDASRAQLMDHEMSRFQILHFATHGVVNSEHPELSGIVLSMVNEQGAPEDGFFQLHDIYKLKLSAQLVVLSACSSGLGKNVRGEGFIGLTRAFMYAGTRSTVASLWRVDDNATTELMRQFYSAMLNDHLSPPAALKSAKEKMWRHPRWRHPFYWAAFVIQGEYVGTIKYDASRSSSAFSLPRATAVTGALLVLVIGFYLTRRLKRRRASSATGG